MRTWAMRLTTIEYAVQVTTRILAKKMIVSRKEAVDHWLVGYWLTSLNIRAPMHVNTVYASLTHVNTMSLIGVSRKRIQRP